MENEYTYNGDITAENFQEVLCSISYVGKKQYELVFKAGVIEDICREKQYPCYKFAHNLEGEPYMRAKVDRTTLEFLIRNSPHNLGERESLILQIKNNGEKVYNKPEKIEGTIYVT